MNGWRSTRRWSLDEKNWLRGWWIPLVVIVLAAATWGFLGFVEGGCKRGPRGGCAAADGYELRSWVLFLPSMPTLFVVGTGLTADRWPPAWASLPAARPAVSTRSRRATRSRTSSWRPSSSPWPSRHRRWPGGADGQRERSESGHFRLTLTSL
ncbi:hypothetical protein ACFT5C_27875 [Streptomyces sp. NPDC057116]|uniref:hypothetical protein n=1 Tax=Streptomyces sp. NPDC057116 TaxID=3346023 RepID=UPI0036266E5A